ncbi:protein kinase domain-containing protein [Streptomyces sp. NRRL S-241]|uniref:class III lanthionine synthetase LanKC N-terminal domain-containing protein n=1 Tax=Streptomyces sp. NRRL S-241 TaxID=1463896 RepID=UPI000691FAB7|nr:hypothetical protein [Streptomyces sp. NRRL S-241]
MEQQAALAAHHLFGLVDHRHYEPLSRRALTPEYRDALQRLLPDTWALERADVWLHARMPAGAAGPVRRTTPPPTQGFKIHVSSAPAHTLRLFDLVVPVCVDNGVEFKAAADPVMLGVINSKTQERGFSGKFMTIYPPDEDVFTALIETLYRRTADEPVEGPYILSDRRYRDSKVLFYRYGGFRPPRRLNIDGTQSTFLVSPDGAYVADERLPYFRLPPWVRDPFAAEPAEDATARPAGEPAATLLNGRYRIEGALAFSNAGGVYHGTDDVTRTSVVVKEARRLTNCWTAGDRTVDSVDMLRHEYGVLRRLEGLEFVPRPVDLFREWEHTFLVEERVEGIAFHDFWAQDDVILAPYIRREGRVERFVPRFRTVAGRLIRMIEEVHARGVVLGDLSPNNILIDAESLRMWFIDFESAVHEDDGAALLAYGTRWGTPGFLHPDRASRDRLLPCDDWYAAAMLLHSSVVPATAFFALNPRAQDLFLDRLVALGVPAPVRSVVSCLAAGRVDEAKSVLADWEDG